MTAALDTAARTAQQRTTRRDHYARRMVIDGRPIAPLPAHRHGRLHTYQHYGCRCVQCCDVARDYRGGRSVDMPVEQPEVRVTLPLDRLGTVVVAPQPMRRAGAAFWRCKLCGDTGEEPGRDDARVGLFVHARERHQAAQEAGA